MVDVFIHFSNIKEVALVWAIVLYLECELHPIFFFPLHFISFTPGPSPLEKNILEGSFKEIVHQERRSG